MSRMSHEYPEDFQERYEQMLEAGGRNRKEIREMDVDAAAADDQYEREEEREQKR